MKSMMRKLFPNKVYNALSKIYRAAPYYLFRVFKLQPKIVFDNFEGKGYGDNPKYIAEEIIRKKLAYDMVWLIKDGNKNNFPREIRTVKFGTIKACYELSTAKIWVDNIRKSANVKKRKGQYYIQTWHGGIALKKVEADVEHNLPTGYVKNAKYDSKIANLFISNSNFCTNMYRKSFWYDGEIMECGYPRNDILVCLNTSIRKKVLNYFNLGVDTKILLYAPTFRANNNIDVYDLQYDLLLTEVKKRFGGEWVVLIRLHPKISQKSKNMYYDSRILNASIYDDMQELMSASDIFITDYSSTMFEFAITKRPVLLYAVDIDGYKEDRDFYFDLFSLPFPLAQNINDLLKIIHLFDFDNYQKKINDFLDTLDLKEEGTASEKVVERIRIKTLEYE